MSQTVIAVTTLLLVFGVGVLLVCFNHTILGAEIVGVSLAALRTVLRR